MKGYISIYGKFILCIYLSILISVASMPTSPDSIEMLLVPLTVSSVDGTDTDSSLGAATLTVLMQMTWSYQNSFGSGYVFFCCCKLMTFSDSATQTNESSQRSKMNTTRLKGIFRFFFVFLLFLVELFTMSLFTRTAYPFNAFKCTL